MRDGTQDDVGAPARQQAQNRSDAAQTCGIRAFRTRGTVSGNPPGNGVGFKSGLDKGVARMKVLVIW
jgi:hypothetical protein